MNTPDDHGHSPDTPAPSPPGTADAAKAKKEIHVVSVPHDDDAIARDMAELFEEDQVTHQHGSAEPEGD